MYEDRDGRCVAVQVIETRQQTPCNCVAADTCASGDIEIETVSGTGSGIAVSVANGGVDVNIGNRRRKRSIGAFLDSVLGGRYVPTGDTRSAQGSVYVPGILDLIPGIDVRVGGSGSRHGLFGEGIGVAVGNNPGSGVRVNVDRSRVRPFGLPGIRVNVGGVRVDTRGDASGTGSNCPTCGGIGGVVGSTAGPVVRPTRRRVVTPQPARCPAGQVRVLQPLSFLSL